MNSASLTGKDIERQLRDEAGAADDVGVELNADQAERERKAAELEASRIILHFFDTREWECGSKRQYFFDHDSMEWTKGIRPYILDLQTKEEFSRRDFDRAYRGYRFIDYRDLGDGYDFLYDDLCLINENSFKNWSKLTLAEKIELYKTKKHFAYVGCPIVREQKVREYYQRKFLPFSENWPRLIETTALKKKNEAMQAQGWTRKSSSQTDFGLALLFQ